MRRHLTRLLRIIIALLLGLTFLLMAATGAFMILSCFHFERPHLVWIWIPFTRWRFRLLVTGYTPELRTVFGSMREYDYPQEFFMMSAFAVALLNCFVDLLRYAVENFGIQKPVAKQGEKPKA